MTTLTTRPVIAGLGTVTVLRRAGVDCSNGGLSSRYDRAEVYTSEQINAMSADQAGSLPEHTLVLLQRETLWPTRRVTTYLVPLADVPEACAGWMFGGNYAEPGYRLAEALGSDHPVRIHDRAERA